MSGERQLRRRKAALENRISAIVAGSESTSPRTAQPLNEPAERHSLPRVSAVRKSCSVSVTIETGREDASRRARGQLVVKLGVFELTELQLNGFFEECSRSRPSRAFPPARRVEEKEHVGRKPGCDETRAPRVPEWAVASAECATTLSIIVLPT